MPRPKMVPAELRAAHPDLCSAAWLAEARRVGDAYSVDPRKVAARVRAVLNARKVAASAAADAVAAEARRTARAARRRAAVDAADVLHLDRTSADPAWHALRRLEIEAMNAQLGVTGDDGAPTVVTDAHGRSLTIRST